MITRRVLLARIGAGALPVLVMPGSGNANMPRIDR